MTTDRLRALLAEATPGPWKGNDTVIWQDGDPVLDERIAANDPKAGPIIAAEHLIGKFAASTFGPRPVRGANARLIVAAVNALPALLDIADAAVNWDRDHMPDPVKHPDGDGCADRVEAAVTAYLAALGKEPIPRQEGRP